ncbi:aldo/keto reductase [Pseudonocardia sp. CA-107938]|uniref:aldo/keto reductase n=1 Tax=Pseudonocardia sp. CA-107938 TaxID=3240021 RepID=UPI003D8B0924
MIGTDRLAMGCANVGNLWQAITDDEAAALLASAWDAGIRWFDTAPHYGLGLSERRLGQFLAGRPDAEFVVSTKVGKLLVPSPETAGQWDEQGFAVPAEWRRAWDFTREGVRASLAASAERLGCRIEVALLHDPDEQEPAAVGPSITSGMAALAELREEGAVDRIGIGSKSTDALLAAVRTGLADVVMIAGRYTLLEQPAAARLLPECADRGVEVLVAGVFNSGLLATSDPGPDAHYEYGAVPPAVLEKARELAARCTAHGVELPTAALQFPLRHPAVRRIVIAGADAAQVRQNVARLAEPVPDELWAELAGVPA